MYYKVENLGKIKSATIDLSKDLTIFCGPNNTGKTFLSYAIYGLGDGIKWESDIIPSLYSQLIELELKGFIEINLYDFILQNKEIVYSNNNKSLKARLSILLGVEPSQVEDSKPELKWHEETLLDEVKEMSFSLRGIHLAQFSVSFEKSIGSEIIKLSFKRIELNNQELFDYVSEIKVVHDLFMRHLYIPLGRSIFFLTAERSGITVFGKEMFSNRFDVTSEIQSLGEINQEVISDVFKKRTNVYSKAIQDAIQFQQNIPSHNSESSLDGFRALADQVEVNILKGKISTDENGDIYYSTDEIKISIQQTASTIKSIASLVLFLRYKARSGSTLFIDEPELNLHPDNQRLIARIIAQIVNAGIKVFISTHSDYIIRELNTLILFKKFEEEDKTKELMDRYGYDKKELLNPNKVGVYSFEHIEGGKVVVEPLPLTDSGININSINKAINNQNVISQDIYYSLVEKEE